MNDDFSLNFDDIEMVISEEQNFEDFVPDFDAAPEIVEPDYDYYDGAADVCENLGDTLNLNKAKKEKSGKKPITETPDEKPSDSDLLFDSIKSTAYDKKEFSEPEVDNSKETIDIIKKEKESLLGSNEAEFNPEPKKEQKKNVIEGEIPEGTKVYTTTPAVEEEKDDTIVGDFESIIEDVPESEINFDDIKKDEEPPREEPVDIPPEDARYANYVNYETPAPDYEAEERYFAQQYQDEPQEPKKEETSVNKEKEPFTLPLFVKKFAVVVAAMVLLVLIPLLFSKGGKKDAPKLQKASETTTEVSVTEAVVTEQITEQTTTESQFIEGNMVPAAPSSSDIDTPFADARDFAYNFTDGGTSSSRFETLDDLTFYIDGELNSALSAEKQAFNAYQSGTASADDVRAIVSEKAQSADKINHLLVSNKNEYKKAGKESDYNTMKENLDALIVYGDTLLYQLR